MKKLILASLVLLVSHPMLAMNPHNSKKQKTINQSRPSSQQERIAQLRQRQEQLNFNLLNAAEWGDLTRIKNLLRQGAHAHTTNGRGQTPLMIAAMNGFLEQCKALLACGANVHTQDPEGIPTLHYASHNGYDQICRLFLEHGADPDARNGSNEPALIDCIASSVNNPGEIFRCTKVLLEHGANANLTHHRHTPLMQAAYDGLFPVCELLLQYGSYHEEAINKALIEARLGKMDMEDMEEDTHSQYDEVIALLSSHEAIRALMVRADNRQLQKRLGKISNIHHALQNRELGIK